jgi:ribosomal protein L12E/L44/L45/RPP1/RPP2
MSVMASQLLLMNLPYNCSDRELQEWIESRGIEIVSIRIIRDLVAGVSPAFGYATLKDHTRMDTAVSLLNGKKLRSQIVTAKAAPTRPTAGTSQASAAKR